MLDPAKMRRLSTLSFLMIDKSAQLTSALKRREPLSEINAIKADLKRIRAEMKQIKAGH